MLILVLSLYYGLFTWNKRVNRQRPTDLFWLIISLGMIITTIGIFNIVDGIENVFPTEKKESILSAVFDELLGSKKTQNEIVIEKILFCFYISYTLLLAAILLLTIYIRIKRKKSVANAG